MKIRSIIILVLIFASTFSRAQNLLVANNNPGAAAGTNVFTGSTAIQDALVAAVNGDIIYVVPSSVNYGNLSIDKEVTIFGIGLRPDKNLNAKSVVATVNIDASNVRFSGLEATGLLYLGNLSSSVTLSNIVIENSYLQRVSHTNNASVSVNNVLVRNNVIVGAQDALKFNTSSNVTVTNNVVYVTIGSLFPTLTANTVLFTHNLFISNGGTEGYTFNEVIDCTFNYNIFFGTRSAVGGTSTGNTWDNNLSFGGASTNFSTGNGNNTTDGNVENQDPLFVNMPMNTTWNDSRDFSLDPASPALNVNGDDIGPTGGPNPFIDEGNILPLIQSITIPDAIPVGSDLPVTIKAKGN